MAKAISFIVVFSFLLIPASTLVESNQEGYISGVISNKGLDFAKNLLIEKAISSMVPLQLSDIEKSVKIPVIGKVLLGLSNIIIHSVDVASSLVETGDSGISLVASDATANMNMDWRYSYKTWLVPIAISDHGTATVQVQGMVIWLNAAIINQEGTLKLLLLDCGCHVKDISIKVNGGASWLYQGIIDAFQGKIVSAIEDAITKNIKEGIKKLDSKLQSLPKQMQVNGVVALNVTFVEDPLLSNSSVELKVNGLFNGADGSSVSNYYVKGSQSFLSCTDSAKMVEISLHQNVFESAALVYFNVISASCSAEIYGNNLAGSIRLVNFTENLKWSNIGNLQMHLVQAAMSTILETFFMPYLNSHLSTGFPLPLPHGFTLQNAEIVRLDSKVKVLSDLSFTDRYESYNLNQLPIYW